MSDTTGLNLRFLHFFVGLVITHIILGPKIFIFPWFWGAKVRMTFCFDTVRSLCAFFVPAKCSFSLAHIYGVL